MLLSDAAAVDGQPPPLLLVDFVVEPRSSIRVACRLPSSLPVRKGSLAGLH